MIIQDAYTFVVHSEAKKFCYLFTKMWASETYSIKV